LAQAFPAVSRRKNELRVFAALYLAREALLHVHLALLRGQQLQRALRPGLAAVIPVHHQRTASWRKSGEAQVAYPIFQFPITAVYDEHRDRPVFPPPARAFFRAGLPFPFVSNLSDCGKCHKAMTLCETHLYGRQSTSATFCRMIDRFLHRVCRPLAYSLKSVTNEVASSGASLERPAARPRPVKTPSLARDLPVIRPSFARDFSAVLRCMPASSLSLHSPDISSPRHRELILSRLVCA